jgi:hypothetical protein
MPYRRTIKATTRLVTGVDRSSSGYIPVILFYTDFAQIGDVIITNASVLYNSGSQPTYDLLLCDGSTFDENIYPELYSILGDSNVLPNIPDETGSPFPYKIVADLS